MSSTAIVPASELMGDVKALGEAMVASGFFADARSAAQAVVKILAGRELGLGPAQSMASLHIVSGKLQPSADLLARLVRSSGRYTYDVEHLDDDVCVLAFYELAAHHAGRRLLGRSQFSDEDRSRAGLGGDTWKKYPRNMLFSRAMTNGVTWFCPDVVVPQTGILEPEGLNPLAIPDEVPADPGETTALVGIPTSTPAGGSSCPLTPAGVEDTLGEADPSGILEEELPDLPGGTAADGSSSEPSVQIVEPASATSGMGPPPLPGGRGARRGARRAHRRAAARAPVGAARAPLHGAESDPHGMDQRGLRCALPHLGPLPRDRGRS